MRSYPRNSPEAAGRLLALVLLSDGHVCRSETDTLMRLGAEERLGLEPGSLATLLRDLCEDLLMGMCTRGSMLATIDDEAMALLMQEVTHPILRREVLALAEEVAMSDKYLAEGEAYVIGAVRRQWRVAAEPPPSARPRAAAALMS